MLASIIALGLTAGLVRPDRPARAVELPADLPRLRGRVRGQGAALPVPRLAPRCVPRVAGRGLGGALGRRLEGRGSTASCASRSPRFPGPTHDMRRADPGARRDRARLRLAARLPRARLPRRRRLLEPRADLADHARPVRDEPRRPERRRAPDGQPRARLGVAVPARRDDRAAHGHGDRRLLRPRRDGARPARAGDAAADRRGDLARRAGLERLRRRVPDPRPASSCTAGAGRSSARSRSCSPRCTCCA